MDIVIDTTIEFLFVAAGLLMFVVFAWRRLDFAVATVMFFAPLYLVRIRELLPDLTVVRTDLPYSMNILEVLIWILFTVWVLRKLKTENKKAKTTTEKPKTIIQSLQFKNLTSSFWLPALLIFSGAFISVFAGGREYFETSAGQFLVLFIEPFLFAIVALDVIRQKQNSAAILVNSYVLSAACVAAISALGLVAATTSFVAFDHRLKGFYLSPNHLAMYIGPATLLVIGWLADRQLGRLARAAVIAALILLLAVLYATHSYGAWFGVAGGFLLFICLAVKIVPELTRMPKPVFWASALGALLLGVLLFVAVVSPSQKFINLFDERGQLVSRIAVWRAAWKIGKDHPFLGIGIGTFQEHYLSYQKNFPPYLEWAVPQPHNIFLAFWLQTGMLGLVGFLWLCCAVFYKILRSTTYNLQPIKIAVLAAFAAVLLHGFIDTPFWKNDLALVAAAFIIMSRSILKLPYQP